jgi:hypothetical protein
MTLYNNSLTSTIILFSHLRPGLPRCLFSSGFATRMLYEGVSKNFRTGRLERELQMVQFSATWCSFIAILGVNLASFAALTFCAVSQRMFIVVSVYFVIDSVRKLWIRPRMHFFHFPNPGYMSRPFHPPWHSYPNIWRRVWIIKFLIL